MRDSTGCNQLVETFVTRDNWSISHKYLCEIFCIFIAQKKIYF